MPDDIRSLVQERHAFYEVSPYYVFFDERPVGRPATSRTVHAGFNVDVYGIRTADTESEIPPRDEYAVAYAELEQIAEKVSKQASDFCSLTVIPFPSTAFIRDQGKVEAMLRLRISHGRGLDQAAGLSEQRALEEVEKEIKNLGIARR